jgi:hypothetical protein
VFCLDIKIYIVYLERFKHTHNMKPQAIHTVTKKNGQQVSFLIIGEATRKQHEACAVINYSLQKSKNTWVSGIVAFKSFKDAVATHAYNQGREGVKIGQIILKK